MSKRNDIGLRVIISLILLAGVLLLPVPAFSQQDLNLQNLVVNGNFAGGFQAQGIGYGWGAFHNGQANVGWNTDAWDKVATAGQTSIQMIEIKNALERDRYAGIYQTITVVPGQQYKLTIKGLIRSTEGDINASNYGYRLQYGVDYNGGAAWELVAGKDWHELPWDEQPLSEPAGGAYRFDTFEATLTAQSDHLTLFIRGWKKWINNGSGIFDIQEVSLVGPAPAGFTTTAVEAAAASAPQPAAGEFTGPANQPAADNQQTAPAQPETVPLNPLPAVKAPAGGQTPAESQLPVSGQGADGSIHYIFIGSVALLLVLLAGAVTAMMRHKALTKENK
jgi:hypothetical protein